MKSKTGTCGGGRGGGLRPGERWWAVNEGRMMKIEA